jgi:hypothetical protein
MAPSAGIQKSRAPSLGRFRFFVISTATGALSRRIFAYVIRTEAGKKVGSVPSPENGDVAGCAAVRGADAYLGDSAACAQRRFCSISPP